MRYVVKSQDDTQYWDGKRWITCQRCAKRFSRKGAHIAAHENGKPYRAVRLKKKAKS